MEDYFNEKETEIEFVGEEKPDEFDQIRNIGSIQVSRGFRDKTFWERISVGGSITAKPIVYNDTIYFGACDKNFYALTLDGNEKWRFPAKGTIQSYALGFNKMIIFGAGDHNLYALEPETGRLIWKFQSDGHIGGSPVGYDGRVYFGSSDGNLYSLNALDGKKIWTFKTPHPLITPLIEGGRIFVGYNGSSIYCLNLNGELLWRFNANGWIAAWPAASDGDTIYFGSGDQNLYALRKDGKLKWKFAAKDVVLSPVINNGRIYFGCADNKAYCIGDDGRKVWDFKTEGNVGHVTIEGKVAYFGSYDNHMYAVDKDSGRLIWKFRTNGFVHTNPFIYNGNVIFGSWDGNLYFLDKNGNLLWKFRTLISTPSKVQDEDTIEVKKINLMVRAVSGKEKEKKYKSELVMGDYEATVTEYTGGLNKTYISSKKRNYLGHSE